MPLILAGLMENVCGVTRHLRAKILAPLGQLLVGACLPQTLLGDFILGGCYIAYMPFQILICYI